MRKTEGEREGQRERKTGLESRELYCMCVNRHSLVIADRKPQKFTRSFSINLLQVNCAIDINFKARK